MKTIRRKEIKKNVGKTDDFRILLTRSLPRVTYM